MPEAPVPFRHALTFPNEDKRKVLHSGKNLLSFRPLWLF